MINRKLLSLATLVLFLIGTLSYAYASNGLSQSEQFKPDTAVYKDYIKTYVNDFITKNYSPYYDIKSITINIEDINSNSNGDLECIVAANMNKVLKAKRVEDLPYLKGMMKHVNLTNYIFKDKEKLEKDIAVNNEKLNKQQQAKAAKTIANKIEDVSQYIGKSDDTHFLFKFTAKVIDNKIDKESVKLYHEMIDKFVPAEEILLKSPAELESYGVKEMEDSIQMSSVAPMLYSGYNRLAARDYANTYTSSATTYCPHGSIDGARQNTAYWNTGSFPACLETFCHNDCADYVSQALYAGGIPADSSWWRNGTRWSLAWVNVDSLTYYMYNQKNYWQPSSWYSAAAGGVITMPGHVVMIVKNDTVERLFSGHTNDQLQRNYGSGESGWSYWILW